MEKCKCGRDKNHRGAAFNVTECDECEQDFKRLRPETENFTKEDWRLYAEKKYYEHMQPLRYQVW